MSGKDLLKQLWDPPPLSISTRSLPTCEISPQQNLRHSTTMGAMNYLRTSFGFRQRPSDGDESRSSDDCTRSAFPIIKNGIMRFACQKDKARPFRHGSDPHFINHEYYYSQLEMGNYIRMGWLVKQGHMWKTWKTRFFVLYEDGTLAYYKSKGKRKIRGYMKLNDGIVSIQHVDVRKVGKSYAFQVEKGFYRLVCYGCSQLESELWVTYLRSARTSPSPCIEIDLTAVEEKAGVHALATRLNKIFITDKVISEIVHIFKNQASQDLPSTHRFIVRLEERIIDHYSPDLYADAEIEALPGNNLIKLIRRHIEDRIFLPLHESIYHSLETSALRIIRLKAQRNIQVLKKKNQSDFGIPEVLSSLSDWSSTKSIINVLDCVSIPSHKIEVIVTAARDIIRKVTHHHGSLFEVSDETMSCLFRYVLVHSSLDDIVIVRALLKRMYVYHPACSHNKEKIVKNFLDAIKWIERYSTIDQDRNMKNSSLTLENSRRVVSISTKDIGIQFTTDGYGRGAIVYSVRRQSQAAMSALIESGLSLIAINDEPVILMSFSEICERTRNACLPKRLSFMTEFFYYQLLSIDSEMLNYLMCRAAARCDLDSIHWLCSYNVEINTLCAWEKTHGKQVFGFEPPSSKGSPLHAACSYGHLKAVDALLALGADVKLRNRKGRTPLHVVANNLDLVLIIERLIKAGAMVDAVDKKGLTPLMLMCSNGNLEGVATLLALGADVNLEAWSNGLTPLLFSAQASNIHLVELCLSKGADPNAVALNGETCLHFAASMGNSEMVACLLDHGAIVTKRNRFGQTPAALLLTEGACILDKDEIENSLKLLLNAGDTIFSRDLLGRQLRHLVAMVEAEVDSDRDNEGLLSLECFQLPQKNDGIIYQDIFGYTPEEYSVANKKNNEEIARLITQRAEKAALLIRERESQNNKHMNAKIIAQAMSSSFTAAAAYSSSSTTMARSATIEQMIKFLCNDLSFDMADVVAFALLLDTFSDLQEVLSGMRDLCLQSSSLPRGILRALVVLYLFKKDQLVGGLKELYDLLLVKVMDPASLLQSYDLLEEYRALYAGYFALQSNQVCLCQYQNISSQIIKIYAGDTQHELGKFPIGLQKEVDPIEWVEHVTLLTHAVFCSIPVDDFVLTGSKKHKREHSKEFFAAKKWFQHIVAYVINTILVETTPELRGCAIGFFLEAAEHALVSLQNFDTVAAVLYALQSTAIQRLRRTLECLDMDSRKRMNKMQFLSDKGCREMSQIMRKASNPSMPYLGLFLQHFVGLNELPVFVETGLVNGSRLRKMGELAVEILYRKSVPFALRFNESIDASLHVELPFATEETRYNRSLVLEPRDQLGIALSERSSSLNVNGMDIESEVQESVGSEGTFGFRQWIRKQKVVHRNRSRSSAQGIFEWV